MPDFFADPDVKSLCTRGYERCKDILDGLEDEAKNNSPFEFIGTFLYCAVKNADLFDINIIFNLEYIRDRFYEELKSLARSKNFDREEVYVICYRMALELELSIPGDLPRELQDARRNSRFYAQNLEAHYRRQIEFAEHEMVIYVVKKYVHHPSMTALPDLPAQITKASEVFNSFDEDLSAREGRVTLIQQTLQKQESAFNFVGLYQGFQGLRTKKLSDARWNLCLLWLMGIAMALPPFGKALLEISGKDIGLSLGGYFSLFGFELILIFLFRVCLHSFRSTKAQLLQIDLRMTLCQFIQSYADYAKGVRATDKELLVQFEKIVFSGIVSGEEAIPSTFDGFEKLADLIKAVKSR